MGFEKPVCRKGENGLDPAAVSNDGNVKELIEKSEYPEFRKETGLYTSYDLKTRS